MNVPATSNNKNPEIIYLSIATAVLLVIVVVGYLLITRFNVKVPFISNVINKVSQDEQVAEVKIAIYDEKTKKPNAKFFEMALEKDFEEIKAETGGEVTSPNLYQQDLREEFDKQLDRQIQNFAVTYTDNGFGPGSMTIVQGDLVTFENASSGNLKIVGEGWGSGIELDNKEVNKFSQQFDLLGTYKYSAEGNTAHTGEVIVVKP